MTTISSATDTEPEPKPEPASAPEETARPFYDRFAGSGAAVGDLFRRALAAIFVVAWLSLGAQVRLLIGARGLMPLGDFLEAARDRAGLSFWDFPTLLWWAHGDGALLAGIALGVGLGLAAFCGFWPRLCFLLSTALYLSYAIAGRLFLSFQWDNLLLECGLLAAFLPAGRGAPLAHLMFRILLFKLYFESGIAKWQSPLHDWQDGSAMTLYYETAPLPTLLGWAAHNLPLAWHHFESRATLFLELVVPLAIFAGRRLRVTAAALLTAFQIANAATANYGFFCYLTAALHLFLLDDSDVRRVTARFTGWSSRWRWSRWRRKRERPANTGAAARPRTVVVPVAFARAAAIAAFAAYVFLSFTEALFTFADPGAALSRLEPVLEPALRLTQRLRVVNSYHLFAAITRERIEPELETSGDGGATWTAAHLRHKPGDLARAPDFVAPHQPRVDFQLWFYGLSFERREPSYVAALVGHLCDDPDAVQPLFRAPLPARPDAVRVAYWRYHFTTPAELRVTGNWWRREWVGASRTVPCDR